MRRKYEKRKIKINVQHRPRNNHVQVLTNNNFQLVVIRQIITTRFFQKKESYSAPLTRTVATAYYYESSTIRPRILSFFVPSHNVHDQIHSVSTSYCVLANTHLFSKKHASSDQDQQNLIFVTIELGEAHTCTLLHSKTRDQ